MQRKKNVRYINWHRIDDKYELTNPIDEFKEIKEISNFIIHSYIFLPSAIEEDIGEDEIVQDGAEFSLDGFYFTSDYDKNKYRNRSTNHTLAIPG